MLRRKKCKWVRVGGDYILVGGQLHFAKTGASPAGITLGYVITRDFWVHRATGGDLGAF